MDKIKIFIGSGEASVLERKTLIHSLRKRSQKPLEICVFNGTHNSIEIDDREPISAPMSLRVKYHNITEFSLYRFLIPQLCNHTGRAIFLDSDMICLGDIAELFHASMNGADLLAKSSAYGDGSWGLSVMLLDCGKCRFDLEAICSEIDHGLYTYTDLTCFQKPYLDRHPLRIAEIDSNWNVFDQCDEQTKLIHYTNLLTQPWKHPGHAFAKLWFEHFNEARQAGLITERDIELALLRSYVRRDIKDPKPPPWYARLFGKKR